MISELKDHLVSIAIGVRFGPNFSVEDHLGRIVDSILYSKDSFFNPAMFSSVVSDGEKRLYNEKTLDSLSINNSNIILRIHFPGQKTVKDIQEINDRFDRDIVNGVIKEFKIARISRLGYIRSYKFVEKELQKALIDRLVGKTSSIVSALNVRFSKKYVTPEAIVSKGVNDYSNAIYTVVKEADADDVLISIDYQNYFDPPLDTVSQANFPDFIKKVEAYNSRSFLEWLKRQHSQ